MKTSHLPLILPETFEDALTPVFEVLPFQEAMEALVVEDQTPHPDASAKVAEAVQHEAVVDRPDLIAGLWLYVDELDKAHPAAQSLDSPTGAFWHAIVHRREGDFSNSKYWFRRAAKHPAMDMIDLTGGGAGSGTAVAAYDAEGLVGRVERSRTSSDRTHPELVSAQRKEWKALFAWCLQQ